MIAGIRLLFGGLVVLSFSASLLAQPVSNTAFTYQGLLQQTGAAVSDQCDFQFSLWTGDNAPNPGVQLGTANELTAQVNEGIFTVELDFGADALTGDARWLDIAVCCPSMCAPGYTSLSPRQFISSAPYSVQTRGIFVDENKNVGIGTTSPNALLSVGQGDEAELQVGANPQLSLSKDLSENKFRMQLTGSGHFGRVLQIGRDDTNHDIVLSGDVGIGTDSPSSLLSVGIADDAVMQLGMSPQLYFSKDVSSTKFRMQLTGTGYGGYDLQIGRDDEGHDIGLSGDVTVAGELGVIEHVTIVGSVGIGIPQGVDSKLHVLAANNRYGVLTQAGLAEGSSIGLHVNSTGFSSLAKNAFYSGSWNRFDSTNGAFLLEVDPDGDTSMSAAPPGGGAISWNRAMVVKTNGRIGMGTDNPSVKLHVIGSQTVSGNQTIQGNVVVGDTLDIGLELVYREEFEDDVFATCPAGKVVIGGGCECADNEDVQMSSPFFAFGQEQWRCLCTGDAGSFPHVSYAYCARVVRAGSGQQ